MRCDGILLTLALLCGAAKGATLPLRIDAPAPSPEPIPIAGGIPFPQGVLKSVRNLRLLDAGGTALPCQMTQLAVWPDGSVKWALIETVVKAAAATQLALEYGDRALPADAPQPQVTADSIKLDKVVAAISKSGGGVLDSYTFAGKKLLENVASLHIEALRLPARPAGPVRSEPLPPLVFACRDPNAEFQAGKTEIESVTLESSGPLRATFLVRGHVLLPKFGATLPEELKKNEPAGQVPFTTRVTLYGSTPVVHIQHQIVFTGEPDQDFITRWGLELPGLAGTEGRLILEPGAELKLDGEKTTLAPESRLCAAPLKQGLALIRQGWENRPCAVLPENGAARIDFWPPQAGLFDLRRYARDWAVGESGNTKDPKEIENFAKYAARGLAKSHDVVLYFGEGDREAMARALSSRALLVAPPGWYGSSGALGFFAPEQSSGEFAKLDENTRQRIDYHLFSQDLFGWYGKLTYGFWQSRYGQVHRNDRWDCDYGRWALSLNDGTGRIGHMLMLSYLRTLERRYFDAGEAFGRINYDTNMVHTAQHLEGSKNWWTVKGCSHRHNVQPFGCPYVGMRGSYPVGQRILYLLTGDGVIRDGLEIVAEAALAAAQGQVGRLGNSGGSDGQGSAANALLWKYETTGDKKYLESCRVLLDKSDLIPPKDSKALGYGPSFGLFNAAGEYAELSGDKAFQDRVVALAKLGAAQKDPKEFVYAIAMGVRFSSDEALKTQLAATLKNIAEKPKNALNDLGPETWPGHGGWKTPEIEPNLLRDVPYALAALKSSEAPPAWPKLRPLARKLPAEAPPDWYRPGGVQKADEKVPLPQELLKHLGALAGIAKPDFPQTVVPYVEFLRAGRVERVAAHCDQQREGGVYTFSCDGAGLVLRLRPLQLGDNLKATRVEAACQLPKGGARIASWGLELPLKFSGNGNLIQTTAPGRFRLERCRLDQNDERIPNWLTSEYNWPDGTPLWPKWRLSGVQFGPGDHYRIWRANALDVAPVVCDQGRSAPTWFDLTDRGANPVFGLSVRLLRGSDDLARQAVRVNLGSGPLEIQFHDAAAAPVSEQAAELGLSAVVDLIWHDGWRPPLSNPELTRAQYDKFLDDLNCNENYGLFAYRFALSITHKVKGREWVEKIRDLGIEPREILYGMQTGDALAKHCQKLGVKWDAADVEGSVRRVLEHYRK